MRLVKHKFDESHGLTGGNMSEIEGSAYLSEVAFGDEPFGSLHDWISYLVNSYSTFAQKGYGPDTLERYEAYLRRAWRIANQIADSSDPKDALANQLRTW